MIYEIVDREELLDRMRGINSWIEDNMDSIGNANMYEIMACMIARNNIRMFEGETPELDAEIERMISLRSDSIAEFQEDVPESKIMFDAVRDGLTGASKREMDFICKTQSVPFFINNARRRGFDGDITKSVEEQESRAIPNFEHDNYGEIIGMVGTYDIASDGVKEASYPIVKWTVDNSVAELRAQLEVTPAVDEDSYSRGM